MTLITFKSGRTLYIQESIDDIVKNTVPSTSTPLMAGVDPQTGQYVIFSTNAVESMVAA